MQQGNPSPRPCINMVATAPHASQLRAALSHNNVTPGTHDSQQSVGNTCSTAFTFYKSGSQAVSDQLKAGPCRQHVTMALMKLASKHVHLRALLAEQGSCALQDRLSSASAFSWTSLAATLSMPS